MPEHPWLEELPLHALGALQGEGRARLEEHLAGGCDRCEAELSTLRAAADLLPYSVAARRPPPGVKESLLRRIADVTPGVELAAFPPPIPRSRWRMMALLAAVAAVSVGIGVLVAMTNHGEIEILKAEKRSLAQMLKDQERQLQWLKDPHVRLALLKGADRTAEARFLFHPEARQGLLLAQGLPSLPREKCYQLWVFVGGEPVPAALFDPRPDGTGIVVVQRQESLGTNPERFAVSVEAREGAARPTGNVVLLGGLL
jgi:hypothetical protein